MVWDPLGGANRPPEGMTQPARLQSPRIPLWSGESHACHLQSLQPESAPTIEAHGAKQIIEPLTLDSPHVSTCFSPGLDLSIARYSIPFAQQICPLATCAHVRHTSSSVSPTPFSQQFERQSSSWTELPYCCTGSGQQAMHMMTMAVQSSNSNNMPVHPETSSARLLARSNQAQMPQVWR